MGENPLFEDWETNVCTPSKPLGQWTKRTKKVRRDADKELNDRDDR